MWVGSWSEHVAAELYDAWPGYHYPHMPFDNSCTSACAIGTVAALLGEGDPDTWDGQLVGRFVV